LVWKSERNKPPGRTRRRYEDDIKVDLNEEAGDVIWLQIGTVGGLL